MALIPCPAPNCDEEVVDNWLTCPQCSAPIQMLTSAPPPPEDYYDELDDSEYVGEDGEETPAARLIRLAREQEKDPDPDPDPDPEDLGGELPEPVLTDRQKNLLQVGYITMSFGGLALFSTVGLVALQSEFAAFLGFAALALCGGGWMIANIAQSS